MNTCHIHLISVRSNANSKAENERPLKAAYSLLQPFQFLPNLYIKNSIRLRTPFPLSHVHITGFLHLFQIKFQHFQGAFKAFPAC